MNMILQNARRKAYRYIKENTETITLIGHKTNPDEVINIAELLGRGEQRSFVNNLRKLKNGEENPSPELIVQFKETMIDFNEYEVETILVKPFDNYV